MPKITVSVGELFDNVSILLIIKDNGVGMTNEELEEAMRLGSKSPLYEREKEDLGRFGLGLKTASFSQAKKLIVKILCMLSILLNK